MNEIITCIADIHIYDYPTKNPTNRYRLEQARIVANNIIEAAKAKNSDTVFIAGDIIEKPVTRPYILAEVKLFLNTIMSYFKEGYIIWGNHDLDNKGINQDFADCYLSVMLPDNLYYAHQKIKTFNNTTIAFSNWQPEFDLSWIQDKVDILLTHATICYSNGDFVESQKMDESKFDLAICGDIHKMASRDKYVSIGVPQRCKMGDAKEASCVFIDTVNRKYEWGNLNPNDNLLKFEYTSDKDSEGYDSKTNTWYAYKSATTNDNGVEQSVVNADDLNDIITEVITVNGLGSVHSEVLNYISQNNDEVEFDFNFTLNKLTCNNWRSISNVTINFEKNDKILILGDNGAGKSSLLTAIIVAFVGDTNIREYVKFGESSCSTEVEFTYKGIVYTIKRGCTISKTGSSKSVFGLTMGGQEIKFANKKAFDSEIKRVFPFTEYLEEIAHFDTNHPSFLGTYLNNPERKSELISKFFGTSRVDMLNEAAKIIISNNKDYIDQTNKAIALENSKLEYVVNQLNVIQLPQEGLDELTESLKNCKLLYDKWLNWNEYDKKTSSIQTYINQLTSSCNNLNSELNSFRSEDIIDSEIAKLISEFNSQKELESSVNQMGYNLKLLKSEYESFRERANKVYSEYQIIETEKTCPLCHQKLENPESLDAHKKELAEQLKLLYEERDRRINEINEAESKYNEAKFNLDNSNKTDYNSLILERQVEKTNRQNTLSRLERETAELDKYKRELENLSSVPVQEVVLPDNFTQKLSEIQSKVSIWDNWNKLSESGRELTDKINQLNELKQNQEQSLNNYYLYYKLTSPTGEIYRKTLDNLANKFSDNEVIYKIVEYKNGQKEHLDLASYFNNNGNWISFKGCSSGQRTLLDVHFLSKIITGLGVMILDEFLKHLDSKKHDVCMEIISKMNIGCILLSSHADSIAAFNNKTCHLVLDSTGTTNITLTRG